MEPLKFKDSVEDLAEVSRPQETSCNCPTCSRNIALSQVQYLCWAIQLFVSLFWQAPLVSIMATVPKQLLIVRNED